MQKKMWLSILIAFLSSNPASALVPIELYEETMRQNRPMEEYIMGVVRGIEVAVILSESASKKSICINDDFNVDFKTMSSLIKSELKSPSRKGWVWKKDTPIEAVVFVIIQKKYPCK